MFEPLSLANGNLTFYSFVGLTPGILVSYSVFQWIGGLFGSRRGLRRRKEQYQLRHALRYLLNNPGNDEYRTNQDTAMSTALWQHHRLPQTASSLTRAMGS